MSESSSLSLLTACGRTFADAIVCAELYEPPEGAPPRTFLYETRGQRLEPLPALPSFDGRIGFSWASPHGEVYFACMAMGVLRFDGRGVSPEKFPSAAPEFSGMLGFGGASAAEDVILLCSNRALFVREAGKWIEHRMPKTVEIVLNMHGLSSREVYICTDQGLLLWNGKTLEGVEGPKREEPMGVLVISDQEMWVAGDDKLWRWTSVSGWKSVKAPTEDFACSILQFHDEILVASLDGVVVGRHGHFQIGNPAECNTLIQLGDRVVAGGLAETHIYDGKEWTPWIIPSP